MVKPHSPQIGGVHEQMTDLLSKYGPPTQVVILFGIFLGVVFLPKIPKELAEQSDTVTGRLFHAGLVYFVTQTYGWTIGIVLAVFSALLISAGSNQRLPAPGSGSGSVKEGFNSDIKIIDSSHKWFVEKVLGENPLLIEEENVITMPVQSTNRRGTGSYGGGVQNTSVSM
jgi:hypothetical protein